MPITCHARVLQGALAALGLAFGLAGCVDPYSSGYSGYGGYYDDGYAYPSTGYPYGYVTPNPYGYDRYGRPYSPYSYGVYGSYGSSRHSHDGHDRYRGDRRDHGGGWRDREHHFRGDDGPPPGRALSPSNGPSPAGAAPLPPPPVSGSGGGRPQVRSGRGAATQMGEPN